ncbi:MAG: hypothetical protein ACLQG3_17075 [Terracidiphilus sp.]
MNKFGPSTPAAAFCGVDVSAASLAAALFKPDQSLAQREFPNTHSGHRSLLAWLGRCGALVRVSPEATGIYSLDGVRIPCSVQPKNRDWTAGTRVDSVS